MNRITFDGAVLTGEGNGKKYLQLPWVKQQVKEKLSFTPYLGTLNLRLTEESTKRKKMLAEAKSFTICPPEGYCVGLLYKASIGSLECAVVLPKVEGYPESVLEIIAPVNLREALNLKDGDTVTVSVQV